jgi:hypothetical protein
MTPLDYASRINGLSAEQCLAVANQIAQALADEDCRIAAEMNSSACDPCGHKVEVSTRLRMRAELYKSDVMPEPPKGKGRTTFSYKCKIGEHPECAAKGCKCPCGHGSPR